MAIAIHLFFFLENCLVKDIVHLDIETFSECDLKKSGVYRYAEDPSTKLRCVGYSFNKEKPLIWVPAKSVPKEAIDEFKRRAPSIQLIVQPQVPLPLRTHIEAGKKVHAFNAQFERVVLNGEAGEKVNFPKLEIDQMVCVAVQARSAGMPDDLGSVATALGTHLKSDTGHLIMLQLAKPRKPSKDNPDTEYAIEKFPEKYAQLWAYNADDILAEAGIGDVLPEVSEDEWAYYRMDQRMNDRGVYVDMKAIGDFQALIDEYKAELEKLCLEWTGCKPTQREQIADWIRSHGYPQLTDLQADTVKKIVAGEVCPPMVKNVLRLYSTYGMKAVTKYKAITQTVCKDGRIRGMFIFYGAATTGRWSAKLVQLQNLFRPVIDDCDTAFDVVAQRDLQWVKDLYDVDPMKVFASCIRGVLCAEPGRRLMAIDYSGIESRYVAWMFDEHWKIKVFRDYDTILGKDAKGKTIRAGFDNYTTTYAELFGLEPREVTKAMRQIGKPIELSLAYEGGAMAFVTMAANYNVDLKEMTDTVWSSLSAEALDSAEWMWENRGKNSGMDKKVYLACDAIKHMWRAKHPKITEGWKHLKNAAIAAVRNPGQVYSIPNKKVMFKVVDRWLVVRLPSGRKLRYFEPQVSGEGRDEVLTYIGVDTETRRWMRTSTYGGKWCENICQGGSSDFIRYGTKELEEEGYFPSMLVHDEVVGENYLDFHDLRTAEKIYTRKKEWAKDFPLACEGFEAIRFRK